MKKIITFILALIMAISFTACANKENTTTEIIGETSFPDTTFNVNGHTIDLPFYGIEDAFILDMADLYGVNTKFYVYGTDELTTEILEHRTEKDGFIIERCIGMVTNRENAGDGIVLNANDEYYISYRGVDFPTCDGTIILSYFIYNPDTTYTDDIMERYDFVLSREIED